MDAVLGRFERLRATLDGNARVGVYKQVYLRAESRLPIVPATVAVHTASAVDGTVQKAIGSGHVCTVLCALYLASIARYGLWEASHVAR